MTRLAYRLAAAGWCSSLALHAAAITWLLQSAPRGRAHIPSTVTMSVVAPPRLLSPAPVPERAPVPPAAKALAAHVAPKLAKAPPKVTPVAQAPADLTGVTLTGSDGAGWASMTGNGQAIDTPIVPTVSAQTATEVQQSSRPTQVTRPLPPPVPVVPVKDLASKPTPPVLNTSLLANYPALAKRQGLAGSAKLLVRIDPDGVVRQCTVRSESNPDFGAACRRTLLGSRWSPPRDRLGNAVVTQVYYTCDFRVNGS
jgi:TonB family protein